MRRCVLSLGVGQKFAAGLSRQRAGLKANEYHSSVVQVAGYWPPDCPIHAEIPYGFKPWMIDRARTEGYDQVLWMDASCVPVKPIGPVFDRMARVDGVMLSYSPDRVWEWCSDACAEKMGVPRAKLMGMCPSTWATVIGFDFSYPKANEFLDKWLAYSRDGVCFHGAFENDHGQVSSDPRVKGHRHDQTVASILAFQMGLSFTPGIVEYDLQKTLLLDNYHEHLVQPEARTYILSQHDVKTSEHSE